MGRSKIKMKMMFRYSFDLFRDLGRRGERLFSFFPSTYIRPKQIGQKRAKNQVWEEGLREYLPWLKPGPGVFKGGGAQVVVHKISDSFCGVLHLPARGQGVLLDHPATGRGQWARSQPGGGGGPILGSPPTCGSKALDTKSKTLQGAKFTGVPWCSMTYSQYLRSMEIIMKWPLKRGSEQYAECGEQFLVPLLQPFVPSPFIITDLHQVLCEEK